jgi:PST family polysaccharide transporter
MSLRSTASNGIAFTALGQGIKLLVHLTAILTLSRILGPSNFGVFAMISPLLALATIIRDNGMNTAILQRGSINEAELTGLFWMSVSWGAGLAVVLVLSAPLIAAFYDEPRLVLLVAASGIIVLGGSFSLQHTALLNRQFQFRSLAVIDAGSLAAGYFVGTIVALLTRSYWALWAVNCTTTFVILAASWVVCRWRPDRPGRGAAVGEMLRLGGSVALSSLFDFLIRSVDNVLIGRFRGPFELGLYDRSYRIVLLPLVFVTGPLDRLVLPSLAQMQDDDARYRRIYQLALQAPLLAIVPAMVVLMAIPAPACAFLLGPEWVGAAPLLAWLSLAGALQLVLSSFGSLLISQGRATDLTYLNGFSFVFALLSYALGLPFGALGVAAAYAISEIVRTPIAVWWATRTGPVRARDVWEAVLPFVFAGTCAFAAVFATTYYFPSGAALLLVASVATSYAVTLVALGATDAGRTCLREAVRLVLELRASLGVTKRNGLGRDFAGGA